MAVIGELALACSHDINDETKKSWLDELRVFMHCFLCEVADGSLTLLEHEAARWLTKEQLGSVRWLPADEEVVNNCLMKVKNAEAARESI